MVTNEDLQTTSDSILVNQLSIFICAEIIPVLQSDRKLVFAKYQSVDWSQAKYQSALLAGLNKKNSSLTDTSLIIRNIKQYLGIFLIPSFFESSVFNQLETRICSFIHNHSTTLQEFKNGRNNFISSAIAILLLDVENLQLNTETEQFLTTACTYPIQVKIAFANWRSMGKLDVELHGRGYDLIHVPAGRDNADGKMIAFGSSIHERYPNAKEVLVCSSDKVMTNLCNHLQQQGLIVYQVSQQGSNVKVFNINTGNNYTYSPVKLPSITEFIQQIKDIILEEESRGLNQWLTISKIAEIFHKKYKIAINKFVSHHFLARHSKIYFLKIQSL
jgi:hypothetical protein